MSLVKGTLYKPSGRFPELNGEGPYYPNPRDPQPQYTWEQFTPDIDRDMKQMYEGFRSKNMIQLDIRDVLLIVIISTIVSYVMCTRMIRSYFKPSTYGYNPNIRST